MNTSIITLLIIVGMIIAGFLVDMLYHPEDWTLGQIATLFGGACLWGAGAFLMVQS